MKNTLRKLALVLVLSFAYSLDLQASAQQLSQLAWMAGNWVHQKDKEEVRENWLGPRGDVMVAVNLTHQEGSGGQFEFLRIARKDGRIVYFASPGGRAPVEFPLKELGASSVVFENMAHDFPQRIMYTRIDANTLVARIVGKLHGKDVSEEWRFSRAP